MTNQDLDNIRRMAQSHRVEPRPQAWERVNSRLVHQASNKRLGFYRRMSIAAVMIAVVSVTALFTQYFEQRTSNVLASNKGGTVILEELDDTPISSLYNVDDVNGFYKALQTMQK